MNNWFNSGQIQAMAFVELYVQSIESAFCEAELNTTLTQQDWNVQVHVHAIKYVQRDIYDMKWLIFLYERQVRIVTLIHKWDLDNAQPRQIR